MSFFGELAAVSLPWLWLTKLAHEGYLWSLFISGLVVPQTSAVILDQHDASTGRTDTGTVTGTDMAEKTSSSSKATTLRKRKQDESVPVLDTDTRSKINLPSAPAPDRIKIVEPVAKRRFDLYITEAYPLLMSVDKEATSEGECRLVATVCIWGVAIVVLLSSVAWAFDVLLTSNAALRGGAVLMDPRYFDRAIQALLLMFAATTLLFLLRIRFLYSKERSWFNWTLGGICTTVGFWTSVLVFFQHDRLDSWFDMGFTPGLLIAARYTELLYGRTAARVLHVAYRMVVAVLVFAIWSLLPIAIDHEHGLVNDDLHVVDTHTPATNHLLLDYKDRSAANYVNTCKPNMPLSKELRLIVKRITPTTVEGWLLRPLSISLPFFWTANTSARLYQTFKSVAAVEVFRLLAIGIMTLLSFRYYRLHTQALAIRQACRLPQQLQSPTTNANTTGTTNNSTTGTTNNSTTSTTSKNKKSASGHINAAGTAELPRLTANQREQVNRNLTMTFSTHAFELLSVRVFFLLVLLSYWTSCVWPAISFPSLQRCPKTLTFVEEGDTVPFANVVYRQYQRWQLPSSLLWQEYCAADKDLGNSLSSGFSRSPILEKYIKANNFIEVLFPPSAVAGAVRVCVVSFLIAYAFQTFIVSAVYRAVKNAKLADH